MSAFFISFSFVGVALRALMIRVCDSFLNLFFDDWDRFPHGECRA